MRAAQGEYGNGSNGTGRNGSRRNRSGRNGSAGNGSRRAAAAKARKRRRRRRQFRRMVCAGLIVLLAVAAVSVLRREAKSESAAEPDRELYPESLLELMERYPETEQFVLDYPKNKDRHAEIDLTGEVRQGTIPLFLQWDERWGYETYGSDFLAITGCGPTCLSMVWCGLTGETGWNPLEVARWAQEQGYYVEGAGSSWDLMSSGARELGLNVEEVVFDGEHILETLRGGHPIICVVGPGDFTTAGHFIVLSGVDEEGRVVVRDPNSRINSEKTWDVEELIPQIRNLWSYS